jgi:hypothetical protein
MGNSANFDGNYDKGSMLDPLVLAFRLERFYRSADHPTQSIRYLRIDMAVATDISIGAIGRPRLRLSAERSTKSHNIELAKVARLRNVLPGNWICSVGRTAHSGPVLIDVGRTELAMPPSITVEMANGARSIW